MKRSTRMKRLVSAFASMVLGSILVLGMVVLINHFADGLDRNDGDDGDQIVFERKPPPKKEVVQQPKPKPKPRRAPRTPPPPLAGLSGNLSGIDFGLPGFDMSDLNALDGDLLGGADSMVMTDDTVDDPPRATFQSPMQYPPRAKAQGVKGYVVLSLLIGVTGEIEQIEIVESSPEGVFDEVAVQGVSTWRFEPATYQGKAVRAWAKQRVRFDLS
ncbi:energy transducer TonB [Marinihelvus fidelis]|nr:energy transducer TonB [Marinihelvus fidelis]